MTGMRNLDPAILTLPVSGKRLGESKSLGDLVREPAILAFLRHCG